MRATDSLDAFLARTDILVCLLPLTPATRGLLDATPVRASCRAAPRSIRNGRGAHLNQQDLLTALDSGQLQNAILDVTDPEPLPAGHPLWTHPRVRITPHIASATRPDTAVDVVLDNLRRPSRRPADARPGRPHARLLSAPAFHRIRARHGFSTSAAQMLRACIKTRRARFSGNCLR